MKVQLELTLAEAEALYRSAAEFPMSDPTEFVAQRGKRAYSALCDGLDKLNRAKNCFVFHQQVKSQRDMHGALPVGIQGGLELFDCPHCHSTLSRRVQAEKVRT